MNALRAVVAVTFICVVACQDGTRGYVVRQPAQFLVPSKAELDKYTLGARRQPVVGSFGPKFTYNCTRGVGQWKDMGFSHCSSELQSPIDITASRVPSDSAVLSATNVMAIDFSKTLFLGGNEDILNLTVAPRSPKPNRILWEETGDEHSNRTAYFLDRIEFHHPAEHLINGQRFALEVQFHLRSKAGQLLSVAVLGRAAPPQYVSMDFLSFALDQFPMIPETNGSANLADVDPSIFLPRLEGFWSYTGTHTSPPCSEQVRWIIMHYPVNVTRQFIDSVSTLVNIRYPGGNARPVQNRDLGFQAQIFAKPAVGGELLFTGSIALTAAQMNRTRMAGHVEWPSEPTVVDIAKQWALVHAAANAPTSMFEFGDEWAFLTAGRPRTLDNNAKPSSFNPPVSTVLGSMYDGSYVLSDKCGPTEDPLVDCINAMSEGRECDQPVNPKLFPPAIAPGSELLRNPVNPSDADYQVTPVELRGISEQAVQRTDGTVLHIIPDNLLVQN